MPAGYMTKWDEIKDNPFSIVDPLDNQLIKYDAAKSKWTNRTTDFVTITGDQSVSGNKTFSGTTTVSTPVNASDIVTKAYVDALIEALIPKINELESQPGLVLDFEGNLYTTIKIGNQVWMNENLKTTKLNDGTVILSETDNASWAALRTPGYCCYNNDEATYKDKYGALYNWYAVNTGKLCPTGWHVPTEEEWTTLKNYLIANGYNYDGTTADNKIAKALAAVTGWGAVNGNEGIPGDTSYPDKRNATGFTALPGGMRWIRNTCSNCTLYGYFVYEGGMSTWWSSTSDYLNSAIFYRINRNEVYLFRDGDNMSQGSSIRCLRD
jgi:uncharacterized protein (TIGR02145 family)